MAEMLSKMQKTDHSDNRPRMDHTAGRGERPATLQKISNNYNETNFNGGIRVESQDPDDMARKLKHRARMKSIRSGGRDHTA
jgi:hypothetical protein